MLMKNMENKRIMLIAALMNLAGNNNSVIEKDRKVLEGKNKSIHNVEQHIDKAISNNNKINVNVGKHKNEKKVIEERMKAINKDPGPVIRDITESI